MNFNLTLACKIKEKFKNFRKNRNNYLWYKTFLFISLPFLVAVIMMPFFGTRSPFSLLAFPAIWISLPALVLWSLTVNPLNLTIPWLIRAFSILVIIFAFYNAYKFGSRIQRDKVSSNRTANWLSLLFIWMIFSMAVALVMQQFVAQYR